MWLRIFRTMVLFTSKVHERDWLFQRIRELDSHFHKVVAQEIVNFLVDSMLEKIHFARFITLAVFTMLNINVLGLKMNFQDELNTKNLSSKFHFTINHFFCTAWKISLKSIWCSKYSVWSVPGSFVVFKEKACWMNSSKQPAPPITYIEPAVPCSVPRKEFS